MKQVTRTEVRVATELRDPAVEVTILNRRSMPKPMIMWFESSPRWRILLAIRNMSVGSPNGQQSLS